MVLADRRVGIDEAAKWMTMRRWLDQNSADNFLLKKFEQN